MRTMAVMICLLLSVPLLGQAPPQIPPPGPLRDKWCDDILTHWETVMNQVKSLEATCERTTEDKVFKTKEVYKGAAKYLKGDGPGLSSRASLYLVNAANPKAYEHFVLSGQFIYEVAPAQKEIRVLELPQPKPGENVEHSLVGLLFGMKAAQAKARYKIDLIGADQHYFFLGIEAKSQNDKGDFDKAQLALIRATYLPRQLRFEQVNGNKITWDLPSIQTPAANVRPADFMQPSIPGFRAVRVPAAPPGPSTVRSTAK